LACKHGPAVSQRHALHFTALTAGLVWVTEAVMGPSAECGNEPLSA